MRFLAASSACFLCIFSLLELTGLFRPSPAPPGELVHAPAFLAAATLLLAGLVPVLGRSAVLTRGGRRLAVPALALVAIGIWSSYLTRFHAEIDLTEGETFSSLGQEFPRDGLYRGRFAGFPHVVARLDALSPTFGGGGKRLEGLAGTVTLFPAGGGKARETRLGDGLPALFNGMRLRLDGFGYSPRYVLKGVDGREIDSAWVSMRLFPPGSEDGFRLISPHTVYLRYLPAAAGAKRSFGMRIVRSKDILYNGTVAPGEFAPFDNGRIAIAEVRQWARLSVTRDWGEPVVYGGLVLLAVSLATAAAGRRGRETPA